MKIPLKKPITKDGAEITELNIDLDNITGKDILAAEKEARLMGDTTLELGWSKMFQAILISKTATETVIVDDIMNLSGADFMRVTGVAADFLFGWVLPSPPQKQ
jgi:hypothetical protein